MVDQLNNQHDEGYEAYEDYEEPDPEDQRFEEFVELGLDLDEIEVIEAEIRAEEGQYWSDMELDLDGQQ